MRGLGLNLARGVGALIGVAMLATSPAQAGLLGQTITLEYNYLVPAATIDSILVGPSVEVTCPGTANVCTMLTAPIQYLDIGDTTISYTYNGVAPGGFNPVAPNGMTFVGLNLDAPIVDVLIDTGIAGLDDSRVSFTATSVTVEMAGLALGFSNYFVLTLVTAPEPWSLGCLTAGLIALAATRRRASSAA